MNVDIEDLNSFVPIKGVEGYEILNIYPYTVRNIRSGKELKPSFEKSEGYYRFNLNKKQHRLHQLIANQFIPNPLNLPCVDHENKIKTDNHLKNLRYATKSINCRNIPQMKGVIYNWTNTPPSDLKKVNEYNSWMFNRLHYSESEDSFYTDCERQYRKLIVHINPNSGLKHVSLNDSDGVMRTIFLNKFKRLKDN